MKDGKLGCLGTVAVIFLVFLLIRLAPMLLTLIKIGLILTFIGIIAVVVLVIYFSVHKSAKKTDQMGDSDSNGGERMRTEDPDPALTDEQNEILKTGRAHLMDIRRRATRVQNVPIRTVTGNISNEADKILKTLRKKPELIVRVRQFLNYYLPTLASILEKYTRLEQGGVVAEDISENTLEHLIDIKHAMERQYEALFDDDKLDLTVEMEALKIACLRDGLLTEEDFQKNKEANDKKPNLTL